MTVLAALTSFVASGTHKSTPWYDVWPGPTAAVIALVITLASPGLRRVVFAIFGHSPRKNTIIIRSGRTYQVVDTDKAGVSDVVQAVMRTEAQSNPGDEK